MLLKLILYFVHFYILYFLGVNSLIKINLTNLILNKYMGLIKAEEIYS